MATPESLQELKAHTAALATLHHRAHHELLPSLSASLQLSPQALQLAAQFLDDKLSLYRFLRRAKSDIDNTLLTISLCLQWRLTQSIDSLSPTDIDPIYIHEPLLFFHPQLKDKSGRPCAVLNLKHVRRNEDGSLDALKQFIAWSWELARRYMQDINAEPLKRLLEDDHSSGEPVQLQMSVIVDLKDATLNNLVSFLLLSSLGRKKRQCAYISLGDFFFLTYRKLNYSRTLLTYLKPISLGW